MHMYVCMFVHAHMCTCLCMRTCVLMCMEVRDQCWMSSSISLNFVFWDRIFPWNWISLFGRIVCSARATGSPISPSPVLGLEVCAAMSNFPPPPWLLGIWTQVQQQAGQLSHLSSPLASILSLYLSLPVCGLFLCPLCHSPSRSSTAGSLAEPGAKPSRPPSCLHTLRLQKPSATPGSEASQLRSSYLHNCSHLPSCLISLRPHDFWWEIFHPLN